MNNMSGQDPLPLIDYLDVWARFRPVRIAYTFLEDGERESDRLSFAELAARVDAVGQAGEAAAIQLMACGSGPGQNEQADASPLPRAGSITFSGEIDGT